MEPAGRKRLIFIVETRVILRNQADINRFIIRNTLEALFVLCRRSDSEKHNGYFCQRRFKPFKELIKEIGRGIAFS